MAYRVRVAGPAKQDARDYARFIRDGQKSPAAARRWLDGLYAAIEELRENPDRYSVIPESEELESSYRSFVFHSHRVIYAVIESERSVIVHRVYHGARHPLRGDELP